MLSFFVYISFLSFSILNITDNGDLFIGKHEHILNGLLKRGLCVRVTSQSFYFDFVFKFRISQNVIV